MEWREKSLAQVFGFWGIQNIWKVILRGWWHLAVPSAKNHILLASADLLLTLTVSTSFFSRVHCGSERAARSGPHQGTPCYELHTSPFFLPFKNLDGGLSGCLKPPRDSYQNAQWRKLSEAFTVVHTAAHTLPAHTTILRCLCGSPGPGPEWARGTHSSSALLCSRRLLHKKKQSPFRSNPGLFFFYFVFFPILLWWFQLTSQLSNKLLWNLCSNILNFL